MAKHDTSTSKRDNAPRRLLLHIDDGLKEAIDPDDVYYVDASGDDTIVRLRGAKAKKDVRPLDALAPLFERFGFIRVHRSYLVNANRIRAIRRRGRDWEIQLDPPVNAVIPVSREAYARVMKAFEG